MNLDSIGVDRFASGMPSDLKIGVFFLLPLQYLLSTTKIDGITVDLS